MTHERPTDDQLGEQPSMLVADPVAPAPATDAPTLVAEAPPVAAAAPVPVPVPEAASEAASVVAAPADESDPAPDEHDPAPAAPSRPDEPRVGAGQRLRGILHGVAHRVARRRSPAPPRVARVFDGQRDGRPWFAPEHRVIVDQGERDGMLALLRTGSVVVHAAHPLRDDLGDHDAAVPASLRSDGTWIWSDASAYYLERHWIAPDAELVAHLRTAGPPAPIDAKTWQRLSAAIRPDAWEGTTWPLD